jgi:phosphate transport system substrate-binding protein
MGKAVTRLWNMHRKWLNAAFLATTIVVGLAGLSAADHSIVNTTYLVDPTLASYDPMEVSGRLSIAGSETMRPLLAKLASEFSVFHPNAKIAVEGGGSEDGILEFTMGYSQQRRGEKSRLGHAGAAVAMVLSSSRQLTAEETRRFAARFGYEPLELPIAMDAVAIYVHPSNPIQGLTLAQLDADFGKDRKRGLGRIETWGQLGLFDGWSNHPVHLNGRDAKSGTRRFFQQHVLLDGDFNSDVLEQRGAASELLSIARDPLAIGYAGVIGYESSMIRMVPLAKKAGEAFINVTPETIKDGSYPLRRDLYLYVNTQAGNIHPLVREFLMFVNSKEGQVAIAKAKFYPASAIQVAKNRQGLAEATRLAGIPPAVN